MVIFNTGSIFPRGNKLSRIIKAVLFIALGASTGDILPYTLLEMLEYSCAAVVVAIGSTLLLEYIIRYENPET